MAIDLFKVFMAKTASDEVSKVLNSGYIGQGEKVEQFESQLKDFWTLHHFQTHLINSFSQKNFSTCRTGNRLLTTSRPRFK